MVTSHRMKELWADPIFREKMSLKKKEYYSSPENRQKLIAMSEKGRSDPDAVKRHSDNLRAALSTPEQRERMRQQAIKAHSDPVIKQKHRDAIKKAKTTPEAIERQRSVMKARYEDPKEREMQSDRLRVAMSDPEWRKQHGEKIKVALSNPIIRENQISGATSRWSDTNARDSQSEKQKFAMKNDPGLLKLKLETLHKCRTDPELIKRHDEATKLAMSDPTYRMSISGKNSHMYKNGSSYLPYCHKFNKILKQAIRKFFGFQCILCEKPQSENIVTRNGAPMEFPLAVHHIDHDKEQGCNGKSFNLVPLCTTCHNKEQHHEEEYKIKINEILDDGFTSGKWDKNLYEQIMTNPEAFI